MTFGRILTDARWGEVVKQHSADYHSHDPAEFAKVSVEQVREIEGKPAKTPFRGRAHAIAIATANCQRNFWRSSIMVTEAQYRAILRDCFRLLDALHSARPQAAA